MTDEYTPTTKSVRKGYAARFSILSSRKAAEEEFDRWFLQEIERAEYSGYLRAIREGLHR